MENVSGFPSGSDALGVNEYSVPTITAAGGLPLIVGARLSEPAGGGVVPDVSSTKPLSPEPEHPANIPIPKPVINKTLAKSLHIFCIPYLSLKSNWYSKSRSNCPFFRQRGIRILEAGRGIGAAGEIIDQLCPTA
jgi:hypothetical protein